MADNRPLPGEDRCRCPGGDGEPGSGEVRPLADIPPQPRTILGYDRSGAPGPRRVVGLMSGTSADGVDAALVEIDGARDEIRVRLLAFLTLPYAGLRGEILDAAEGRSGAGRIQRLDTALAEAFAEAVSRVVAVAGVPPASVTAIGSHGQTIWHDPDSEGVRAPFPSGAAGDTCPSRPSCRGTLQIGNPSVLAARTGRVVVSDFRSADMALGGQGAPLVPLVDWLLLRRPGRSRAVQNLGGIGNVTWLPGGGGAGDVIAFDTGPGCMVIDALAGRATGGAERLDRDGALASRGGVSASLLESLLSDDYFARRPPKSTGRERFGAAFAERLWNAAMEDGLSPEDAVATATALTAESIARAYRDFLPPPDEVILGGGGARNPALFREIERRLAPVPVLTHEEAGHDGDAKEAVAFAVLADRTLQGLPGNLPRVTGALRPAILGSITPP